MPDPVIPENGTWGITVRAGSVFRLPLLLTEDDGVTPLDLTGFTGYASAVNEAGEILLTFDVTIGGVEGTVDIECDELETTGLAEDGEWECKITGGSGSGPYTLLSGPMEHERQVAFP